jgi:hypothetical protein
MSYKLFLDDIRLPKDVRWMQMPLGPWIIVRSYDDFVKYIMKHGSPLFVSFDHDLADEHYTGGAGYNQYKEKTGYECAKWLVEYCMEYELPLPEYQVHSLNPIGKENIIGYLENFKINRPKFFHEKD